MTDCLECKYYEYLLMICLPGRDDKLIAAAKAAKAEHLEQDRSYHNVIQEPLF